MKRVKLIVWLEHGQIETSGTMAECKAFLEMIKDNYKVVSYQLDMEVKVNRETQPSLC